MAYKDDDPNEYLRLRRRELIKAEAEYLRIPTADRRDRVQYLKGIIKGLEIALDAFNQEHQSTFELGGPDE